MKKLHLHIQTHNTNTHSYRYTSKAEQKNRKELNFDAFNQATVDVCRHFDALP